MTLLLILSVAVASVVAATPPILTWHQGGPYTDVVWKCFGEGGAAQDYPKNPLHNVDRMLEAACDVLFVDVVSKTTGPAQGAADEFTTHFGGYVALPIKGIARPEEQVDIHMLDLQNARAFRHENCRLWTNGELSAAPTQRAPVRVVVSGSARRDQTGRLVFFVDPCGLFHESENQLIKADNLETPIEIFLQGQAGSYPVPFLESPGSLNPVTLGDGCSFPYNPWFYFLDLSVLTYNLYAQSQVFPWDPYYEAQTGTVLKTANLSKKGRERLKHNRNRFMKRLLAFLENRKHRQFRKSQSNTGIDSPCQVHGHGRIDPAKTVACARGPDVMNHMHQTGNTWQFGPLRPDPAGGLLDPIITRYSNIDPSRRATVSNEQDKDFLKGDMARWRYYVPPAVLTSWKSAAAVFRNVRTGEINIQPLRMGRPDATSLNSIFIFEGGSGGTTSYSSVGMEGLIVVRPQGPGNDADYHVDIVFRGSRSGAAGRALLQGMTSAKGNPDWISDLYMTFRKDPNFGDGKVHSGYARVIRETMPFVLATLRYIHHSQNDRPPTQIYVSGHSMGGGLAILFTKAVTSAGAESYGANLGAALDTWPWASIKLVPFSAPMVGDRGFAKTMNKADRANKFAADPVNPVQKYHADTSKKVTADWSDSTPQSRELCSPRPAMYRIIHPDDPVAWHIPGSKGALKCGLRNNGLGSCLIGQDLYTDQKDFGRFPDPRIYHEPQHLFGNMIQHSRDVVTAPLSQTQDGPVARNMNGGLAQFITQFHSRQEDTTFDYNQFLIDKALYDEIASTPLQGGRQAPGNANPDPHRPQGNDKTGGPTARTINVDALRGNVLTNSVPPGATPLPPFPALNVQPPVPVQPRVQQDNQADEAGSESQ